MTSVGSTDATFLAPALAAIVGADARPRALLALGPAAVMLAHLRSPAFLARAPDALVWADARPQALLALAPDVVMLAYLRSATFLYLWGQMLDPRLSLHSLLMWSCSHMLDPPHSLQQLLRRL